MKSNRKPRKPERLPCAQLESDDGIDPREFFRKSSRHRDSRKTHQLCKQVYRTLSYVLAGQFTDPVLQALSIESVEPAPDASRLLATVRLNTSSERVTAQQIMSSLERVRGALRCEVAAAVHRRKAPELAYRVAGPQEVMP